jgi:hypothetical protein
MSTGRVSCTLSVLYLLHLPWCPKVSGIRSLYLAMDGVPHGMYLSPPFSLVRISSSCSSSLSSVSLPGVETLLKGPFHKILYLRFISSLSPFVCLPTIIWYKLLDSYTCDSEWSEKKQLSKILLL